MGDVIGELFGDSGVKTTPAQKQGIKAREALNEAVKKVTKTAGLGFVDLNAFQTFFEKAFAKKLGNTKPIYIKFARAGKKKLNQIKEQFAMELETRNIAPLLTMVQLRIERNALYFEPKQPSPALTAIAKKVPVPSLGRFRTKDSKLRFAMEESAKAVGIKTDEDSWKHEVDTYMKAYREYEKAKTTKDLFGGVSIILASTKSSSKMMKFQNVFIEKLRESGILTKSVKSKAKGEKVVLRLLFDSEKEDENPTLKIVKSAKNLIAKIVLPRKKSVDAG